MSAPLRPEDVPKDLVDAADEPDAEPIAAGAKDSIAVDVSCLCCGVELLRTEADPGDSVTIPDHVCADGGKAAPGNA